MLYVLCSGMLVNSDILEFLPRSSKGEQLQVSFVRCTDMLWTNFNSPVPNPVTI